MRAPLTLLAVGTILVACSSDNATGPDPRNCTAGSIAVGQTKTGTLNSASCQRYDWEFSADSVFYASYDVGLDSGKAYIFTMHATVDTVYFDGTLELVGKGGVGIPDVLLAISDDEGLRGGSQFAFIAPKSGTFSLRVSGYDQSDTAAYTLTERSCVEPHTLVVDSLIAHSASLLTTDCVLQDPEFGNDSSYIQLISVQMAPNETKYFSITSSSFTPGIQVYGPGFGTPCYYGYDGCGGWADPNYWWDVVGNTVNANNPNVRVAKGSVGGTASLWLTADGYYGWDWWDSHYGYNNWPGLYTMTMGGYGFGAFGPYEITIQSNPATDVVNRIMPSFFSPPLSHLKTKPSFVRTVGGKKLPRI